MEWDDMNCCFICSSVLNKANQKDLKEEELNCILKKNIKL